MKAEKEAEGKVFAFSENSTTTMTKNKFLFLDCLLKKESFSK